MSIIELLKYVFLGMVQGITEVLPISSSGHVALAQAILHIDSDDGILFLILVNFGSFIAILIHFRKLINKMIVGSFRFVFMPSKRPESKDDFDYSMKVLIATIPIGVFGLIFKDLIDQVYQQYFLFVVAFGLLVTSTFLYIVRFAPEEHTNQHVSYRDAVVIGMIQPLSMIPGLSRSGITTSTGLLSKLSMETSLTFSFMLYIPLSIAVFIYQFGPWFLRPLTVDIGFDATNPVMYLYYSSAFVVSFFATKFSLKYIFKWFRQGKLILFSIYTLCLGMIALTVAVMTV